MLILSNFAAPPNNSFVMEQAAGFPDITQIRKFSQESYPVIFNAYWKKLYAIAYHRLRDGELAKDMVQDVFVYCWRQREHITIAGSMEAYLRSALQYRLIAHFRKEDVRSKAFAFLLERMNRVEEHIKDILTEQDLENTLKAEFDEMPDTMREIFKLRIRDYTVPEIADSLDLAEKTVRNNLSRGFPRLRKAIARDFPEDFSAIAAALYILLT